MMIITKSIMNRKQAAAAVAALILAVTALHAQNEADFTVETTANGEGVIITKYTGATAAVHIPETIQNLPVREIGDRAFYHNYTITSVVIPPEVTKIGGSAFSSSWSRNKLRLALVTIPEGVTEIGPMAFAHTSLTAITLPESLTTLGVLAFAHTDIMAVTIPAGITHFLRDAEGKSNGAFYGCAKLRTVTAREGVKEIPGSMFAVCTALTTVSLPEGLETIGESAFNSCIALTTVTLPASIKRIDRRAFANCTALTTVIIPDSVGTIHFDNDGEFAGCSRLTPASHEALKKRGYTGGF